MKYIISESQALNYIKRNLSTEVFYEYIKDACENIIGSTDDEDEFIHDVAQVAIENFLFEAGFFEEARKGQFFQELYETLFDEENSHILEFILEYFEKYKDVGEDDDEEDNLSYDDLLEK